LWSAPSGQPRALPSRRGAVESRPCRCAPSSWVPLKSPSRPCAGWPSARRSAWSSPSPTGPRAAAWPPLRRRSSRQPSNSVCRCGSPKACAGPRPIRA